MPVGTIAAKPARLDSVQEDELRRLLGYWRRKRGPEGWIRSRDFRAEHLSSALPHVAIVERFPCPMRRMLIRMAGRAIANPRLGYMRDRYIGELRPEWYRDHLLEHYAAALASGEPAYERVTIQYGSTAYDYGRLILPMTRDGAVCDQLLVSTIPSPELAIYLRREPDFG